MKTRLRSRGVMAVVLSLVIGGSVTGCATFSAVPPPSPSPMLCPTNTDAALTLVVGARANSPVPQLPSAIQQLIVSAATGGQEIQGVRLDGTPTFAWDAKFVTNAQNEQMRQRDLQGFVSGVEQAVAGMRPKAPQADVLGALSQAARITPAGGTVVLLDSGLSTVGAVNFLVRGTFDSDPQQVTAFLREQNLLPDLSGKSLVLVNVGDTADPQPQLPQELQVQLVKLWTTVAQQAGAKCVYSLHTGAARTAISTSVPVSVVPLPAQTVWTPCGTTVLADDSPVGFVVGTPQFRDTQAADATLAGLAKAMIGHDEFATVAGSTSSEGDAGANQILSVQRAETVKAELVHLNVSVGQITTIGYGIHAPGRVPDMTSNGTLIPWAAEQDRSVTVTLRCPSGS